MIPNNNPESIFFNVAMALTNVQPRWGKRSPLLIGSLAICRSFWCDWSLAVRHGLFGKKACKYEVHFLMRYGPELERHVDKRRDCKDTNIGVQLRTRTTILMSSKSSKRDKGLFVLCFSFLFSFLFFFFFLVTYVFHAVMSSGCPSGCLSVAEK